MKLGSLFDGEAGFPLSGALVGIEPCWASEIEPYPIAISHSRFPNMKHIGDVSMCNGAELEPVDIITFGSPCQDMSVAGKRSGMKHEEQGDEETTRSGLFFEAVRIITEMRESTNGKSPRFAVWENVPGAFSSGGGRDFLAVLQAIAAIAEPSVSIPEPERDSKTDNLIWFSAGSIVGNGWSIAWRTLDAQYWGVPQRRKRIYLVADFGSERAAEILFERYSLHGNIAESGEARKGIAKDANGRVDGSIGIECLNPWDSQTSRVYDSVGVHPAISANSGGGQDRHGVVYPVTARTLAARYDSSPCDDRGQNVVVVFAQNQRDEVRDLNGVAGALAAEPGMKQQTFIAQPVIALQANGIDRADTAGCNGAGWRENEMYTLNTIDRHAVVYPETYQQQVGALCSADYKWVQQQQVEQGKLIVEPAIYPRVTGPLMANSHPGSYSGQDAYSDMLPVVPGKHPRRYIVRRLTPLETTRLQGYPDWWHDLAPFDGDVEFWESVRKTWAGITGATYRPMASVERLERWYYKLRTDAAEYKADGNSLAIPCAAYVIRRISEIYKQEGLTFDT